ncbi:MAG: hypothetical protein LBH43_14045 [Treponema sp.]|jgi:hypothetical protein|nr:hypothetical protein [Treponema sp.]
MLYPKNASALTEEEFKNPSSEYRAAPFWAWNTRLEKDELVRQIEALKELGFGGFIMHSRIGMAVKYLSDEFMDLVHACVEKAREEKMLPWLYDEDRWPSGAAGGFVTKNEDYRSRHLLLTRIPYGSGKRAENGKFLACFDVVLDGEGSLLAYQPIPEKDRARGFKLYAYVETALPSPWFNNQTYLDTLNPAAVREFIRITYERYSGCFEKDFGGLIPAIFTDEPQFSHKDALNFAHEERDIALPWTDDLPDTYCAAYKGEDLIAGLPELIWDLPGDKVSVIRYRYHDHVTERFSRAFADQCGAWCAAHNIIFTGHLMDEPVLESQTRVLGEAMRSYRSFGLPGIDMLCDSREFTTAKQAQSAARQYGRPGVLSELYGVTNWDFDFRGHKLQGDWQAALGVSVRVPHLSWVSMNGEAKRDYPGTFNYQAPWYKEYPYVEDHFARLNTVMTRGRAICRIGVIHPIESYWLRWGPRENTGAVRAAQDENFQKLCDWLVRGLIDFDYICESTLQELCDIEKIGAKFPIGKMNYDAVIVPALETIRETTLDRLEIFRSLGGKLIFLGQPPSYCDAVPDERGRKLFEQSVHIDFDRFALLKVLEEYREVQIRNSLGVISQSFLYQLREDDVCEADSCEAKARWLFISHADREQNIAVPGGGDYIIQINGEWRLTEYNTLNGTTKNLEAEISGGRTFLNVRLWDHDSLLLKLEPAAATEPSAREKAAVKPRANPASCTLFTGPMPITLHEPNVLLLDIAEYALDDGAFSEKEEILRLDNKLRSRLGWPLRLDALAQPWVENDTSTPHTLRLRYTFESELLIKGAELALENAANTTATLNGQAAGPVDGWYVDKCIGRRKLPDIKQGTNALELAFPYGKKVDVEACFILGDFGVNVRGTRCTLTAPIRSIAFGDLSRQGLPFYGGNITYHLEAECIPAEGSKTGSLTIEASAYRFMLLRLAVDGVDRGVIAYAPYRLNVDGLAPGIRKIELTGFGCRINTFGQLHHNGLESYRDIRWDSDYTQVGGHPNSWRTQGPAWSYEYRFRPQGVLKSPEVFSP